MSRALRVSAPGKLMIAGEYVVLDGAPCLVAAVDRRLIVTASLADRDDAGLPPEARATLALAEAELGATALAFEIDARALRSGDSKLGLGSSAAASAAIAGAVLAHHRRDLDKEIQLVLRLALDGHRAIAPEGSGADVAASTLGGLVRFFRDAPMEATSHRWPEKTRTVIVWTGSPARTSDLVRVVRAFREDAPDAYRQATARLSDSARHLADALLNDRPADVVLHADAHGEAMRALGDRAGAPIVEASLDRAMTLARRFGGGAKPSGAGGGDVAIAFFEDDDAVMRFEAACPEAGLTPLKLALGTQGVLRMSDAPSFDPLEPSR